MSQHRRTAVAASHPSPAAVETASPEPSCAAASARWTLMLAVSEQDRCLDLSLALSCVQVMMWPCAPASRLQKLGPEHVSIFRSPGCIPSKASGKVTGESTGRSEGSLKGVVRTAFLEDGKGACMVDGGIMHEGVVAARQMQPLIASGAVAAHLVPAPSALRQELQALSGLRGLRVHSWEMFRLASIPQPPAACEQQPCFAPMH